MFTCGLKETREGEVPLRDTPAQSLELLLDYMYRAQLPLSNDNIQGVAAAAFLLHIDGAFRWAKSLGTDLCSNKLTSSGLINACSTILKGHQGILPVISSVTESCSKMCR